MPITFSSIGAQERSNQEYRKLIDLVQRAGEKISFQGGYYVRWESGDGDELWVTMLGGKFRCITPFFRGKSAMTFGITEYVDRRPETVDGTVHGWMDPVPSEPENGIYPLSFDVVGKHLVGEPTLPVIRSIGLCACAKNLVAYRTEHEFEAANQQRAAEYFCPIGVFGDLQRDAKAFFDGHVVETRDLNNTLTNRPYRWALTKTVGGLVDVVFDPEQIDVTPTVGGILSGSFHLFGDIKEA